MQDNNFNPLRYIKGYQFKNMFSAYTNDNFYFLIKMLAESRGYITNGQIETKKVKKEICNYITTEFDIVNASQKQISRLIQPKKNRVSKYAPLYIIAIYNMLLENWPTDIHQNICCRNAHTYTYSEFSIGKYIEFVEKVKYYNKEYPCIETFDCYLSVVNNKLSKCLGVEFLNDTTKTKIELEDDFT